MFCSKCGYENNETVIFCGNCGERLSQQNSTTQTKVEYEQVKPIPTTQKSKKKKTAIIVAIVLVLVGIVASVVVGVVVYDYIWQLEHQIICTNCGDVVRGNLYINYGEYYCGACDAILDEEAAIEESEGYEYSGDTFTFYSSVYMSEIAVESDDESNVYKWSGDEVDVEVKVRSTPDGYGSVIFMDKFDYRQTYGENVYGAEDGKVLDNGLPAAEVWLMNGENDYSLIISTYTDNYYYEFKISSYDEMYLVQIYDSIKSAYIG